MGRSLLLGAVVVGVVVIGAVAIGVVLSSGETKEDLPSLSFLDGTPGDVMALGDSSFADIIDAFPGQLHCLDDVTVAHNWDLGPEAGFYQNDYIEIEVPNTARQIRRTYLHEFGHHLDANCSDADLRSEFAEAMEHPSSTDWHSQNRPWHTRPSEQFAEAVVAVVGGSPLHPDITLTGDAVAVVSNWARR